MKQSVSQRFRRGVAIAALAVFCRAEASADVVAMLEPEEPEAAESSTSAAAFDGEFGADKALKQIYGNYDGQAKAALWHPDEAMLARILDGPLDGQAVRVGFRVRVLGLQPFVREGRDRYLVITVAPIPYDLLSPQLAPVIGGAVFVRDGAGWRVETARRYVARVGYPFSEGPEGEFVKIGPERYGFLARGGVIQMCEDSGGLSLVGESRGGLAELLALSSAYGENGAGCTVEKRRRWRYETTLSFVAGQSPDNFDVQRVTRGTALDDKERVVRIAERATYVFRDGRYEPAAAP
jgi:hypothetical protein